MGIIEDKIECPPMAETDELEEMVKALNIRCQIKCQKCSSTDKEVDTVWFDSFKARLCYDCSNLINKEALDASSNLPLYKAFLAYQKCVLECETAKCNPHADRDAILINLSASKLEMIRLVELWISGKLLSPSKISNGGL